MPIDRIATCLVVLTLSVICSACNEKSTFQQAKGFWIYADTATGSDYSLDVTDTTVNVNTFGTSPYQLWTGWSTNDSIEARWPFDSFDLAFYLVMRNDTLIKIDENWKTRAIEYTKYV